MSSITNKAAAQLLHRATLDVLHRCRGSTPNKSAAELAECANLMLVDVLRSNEKLLNAIALDYATRIAAELPPLPAQPKPAPTRWQRNLFEPEDEK